MPLLIIFWILIYCFSSAFSIVLLGDRSLISGNLLKSSTLLNLLLNWKFILAMSLAIIARISFLLVNNNLLKIPKLAAISTTLTTFITLLSLMFIVIMNYFFLNERLNIQQGIGAVIILIGVAIMIK